jgi:hypothetical protein
MVKRKRGIIRREKIEVDGKEIEVDTFDAKVILGSGEELESIEELLVEEEIEREIQDVLKKVEVLAQKYPHKEKDLFYCYEVGKELQFVDVKGFTDRKGLIWRRMAYDLHPDLFGRKSENSKESIRYPETMYHLGKQDKKTVKRATLDQWYEILKFKDVYKDQSLLDQILIVCEQGLSSIQLRRKIAELRMLRSRSNRKK